MGERDVGGLRPDDAQQTGMQADTISMKAGGAW